MAITTVLSPCAINTTSLAIIKEFIFSYISSDTLDILDEFPILSESYVLSKPILVLEDASGKKQYPGMGRRLSNGDRGQYKYLSYMATFIINSEVGGASKLRELADALEYIFLVHSADLSAVGLKNPICGSFRTIQKTNYSPFWGGRALITAKVMMRY